jgi:cytochrome b561
MTKLRYSAAARALHWLLVVLVILMFTFGFWMVFFTPKDEAFKLSLYFMHENTGITILLLMLLRLAIRRRNRPPPMPASVPAAARRLAHFNHVALYVLLFAMPVIGFIDTNSWGFPLAWWGVLPIPSPVGKNEAIAPVLSLIHRIGGLTLLCLIILHLAGVFYHGVIRRDGVLRRML